MLFNNRKKDKLDHENKLYGRIFVDVTIFKTRIKTIVREKSAV